MRILVDYRPALRQRTGVGEYIHELVRALASHRTDEVSIFTSSWKDRPSPELSAELGAHVIDCRIPVGLLNALWHRAGWPPVEWLAGGADVVHAAHPLLIPSRHAAQVVTVHDLFFLTDPSAVGAEIRRDYASLAAAHARRAHAVVTSSEYGRQQVIERLSAPPARVHVVPPGAPSWRHLGASPLPAPAGYALFVGTIEPRKNLERLLDAWQRVVASLKTRPRLVLAGGVSSKSAPLLENLGAPGLAGTVEYRGYVPEAAREALFAGARLLVLPSLDEGFGLPVLEAMSAGIPVVASNRGAIPEVAAGSAELVEPLDVDALAAALVRVLEDEDHARDLARRGLERARAFTWQRSATILSAVYAEAIARRRAESTS
ncbi:MAG: glycosyltransferase family 1 protein [Vicinamibacterales bacterium]